MSANLASQNSTGVQQTPASESFAVKTDTCKSPLGLIPRSALIEEAHVLAYGAKKYDAHNWRKGMEWTRLCDAILRHITSFIDGEDFDQESGLHHLAHARASCGFLIEYMETHPELDNRHRRVGKQQTKAKKAKKAKKVKKELSAGEALTKMWNAQQHESNMRIAGHPFYTSPYGD